MKLLFHFQDFDIIDKGMLILFSILVQEIIHDIERRILIHLNHFVIYIFIGSLNDRLDKKRKKLNAR